MQARSEIDAQARKHYIRPRIECERLSKDTQIINFFVVEKKSSVCKKEEAMMAIVTEISFIIRSEEREKMQQFKVRVRRETNIKKPTS